MELEYMLTNCRICEHTLLRKDKVKEMPVTYEMRRWEEDPYCLSCCDCETYGIPVWDAVSEEHLRRMHRELVAADRMQIESGYVKAYEEMYGDPWVYTAVDFGDFLEQLVREGGLRKVTSAGEAA